jgi:hypothetical protein
MTYSQSELKKINSFLQSERRKKGWAKIPKPKRIAHSEMMNEAKRKKRLEKPVKPS